MKKDKSKIMLSFIIMTICLFLSGCGKKYTITFDSNGGTSLSEKIVKEDELVPFPNEPTKEGYKFLGWYYNDEKFNFNTRVTKDMTLVAKWAKIEEETEDSISLNTNTLSLEVGMTTTLSVSSTISDVKYIWTSSASEVASVDENGLVQALKEGSATIKVSTYDGKYSQECLVTVTKANDETTDQTTVEKVTISGKKEVGVGQTIKLTANVSPKTATNKEVVWKSSNPKVATIDENGNVLGIKEGTTAISVTTVDGGKQASLKITVKAVEDKNEENKNPEEPEEQNPETPKDETNPTEPEQGENTPTTPDTEEPKQNDVYVVTIDKITTELTNSTYQYSFKVTKNNETFTDYKEFTLASRTVNAKQGTISASWLESVSTTSTTITLSDGTTVSGTLVINK